MNLSLDGSLCDNPLFICVYKNIFYLDIIKSLSYSSFALFDITYLILNTNSYFDTKYDKP